MTKVAPQNPKNQLSMQNKFEVIDFKPQFQKISFPDQKYSNLDSCDLVPLDKKYLDL